MEARRIGGGILTALSIPAGFLMDRMMPATLTTAQGVGAWVVLAAIAILGLFLVFWPTKKAAAAMVGDSYNNSGNNFGHMGPVNIGRQNFELTPDRVATILARTPNGRPVEIVAVGNADAWRMGEALEAALTAAGHPSALRRLGTLAPAPQTPVSFDDMGTHIQIILFPQA